MLRAERRTGSWCLHTCRCPHVGAEIHALVTRQHWRMSKLLKNPIPAGKQWFLSAFKTRIFKFITQTGVQDRQHTNTSLREEESVCSSSLTVSEPQVISCVAAAGKPNSPQDAVPHGWLTYVVTIDSRQPETLVFVHVLIPQTSSTVGFGPQKPRVLGTVYNLQQGSAPFLSSPPLLLGIYTGFLIFFFLSPDCLQLIQEKVEVTGRVKTHNLIFILSINHPRFQPDI